MTAINFEKTDPPGVFKLTMTSRELDKLKKSKTMLFTRINADGVEEGTERLPRPLIGQIFIIDGEKYEITGYRERLIQGDAEIYLVKHIKTKPEPIKHPIPIFYKTKEGQDYRCITPLQIMVYNDMWNDIYISLRTIKYMKNELDKFIRWKKNKDHLHPDNRIRFSNDEEAVFDDDINQLYRKIRGIFEKIPMNFLVTNYTNRLSDNELQKYTPEQNFMNLKKTNPNFEYPFPFKIEEIDNDISITPYEGNFLTQKIIKKEYNYCGRAGHIPNPLGNKEHEIGHTNMDKYNRLDYFIKLIEPLVNGHAFIIGEGKPTIFIYVTGRFKTPRLYPYGEISTAWVKLEGKVYDDVKKNGYCWSINM